MNDIETHRRIDTEKLPATFDTARHLAVDVRAFNGIDRLDLAIDGATASIRPAGWSKAGRRPHEGEDRRRRRVLW